MSFQIPFEYDALIFDLDGTLADTMPLHYKACNLVCNQYGFEFPYDFFLSQAGRPTIEVFEDLVKIYGHNVNGALLGEKKEAKFLEVIQEVTPIELTQRIALEHEGKIPMAIGSGGQRKSVELTLDVIGMANIFDAVVSCDDVNHPKPHPETFLKAAEIMGVQPQKCVVFEDGEPGIVAAKAAGMHCIDVRPLLK